ncbi:MAG TPA: CDP-alcohol phosphatidyltransferase family protein [Allosphingosinicella sp.]|nr:CDP-alcohol phosphatidyltransferase family protein [Allosphingosinicella sp.]
MGSEKSVRGIAGFSSAAAADQRIAGVTAIGRAIHQLAADGAGEIEIRIGDGGALSAASRDDIERLRGGTPVAIRQGLADPLPLPSSWEIVRGTGKPGDGLVSRWLNRPVSQRITLLALKIPGARPVHVTVFNALLALVMFPIVLAGGEAGLVLGGILFQTASILDGVDGEMARATFRTTPEGATMDSAVDIATNLLFVSAITVHLALRDGDWIGWVGAWAVAVSLFGGMVIAWRSRAQGGPLGFDMLKKSAPVRTPADAVYWAVQTLTGRDCFAFLYMVLIIAGLERTALSIYAGVGAIWFPYVLITLLPRARASFRRAA